MYPTSEMKLKQKLTADYYRREDTLVEALIVYATALTKLLPLGTRSPEYKWLSEERGDDETIGGFFEPGARRSLKRLVNMVASGKMDPDVEKECKAKQLYHAYSVAGMLCHKLCPERPSPFGW